MNRTITPSELGDLMRARKDVAILDVLRQSDFDVDKEIIPWGHMFMGSPIKRPFVKRQTIRNGKYNKNNFLLNPLGCA